MLRQLEEMTGSNVYNRSSSASTPSSKTLSNTCTGGNPSVVVFSPTSKTVDKYFRPMDDVILDTRIKGTLIQRLDRAEDHLLKLCVQLEEEKRREAAKVKKKKGIKQFVKQCVGEIISCETREFNIIYNLIYYFYNQKQSKKI